MKSYNRRKSVLGPIFFCLHLTFINYIPVMDNNIRVSFPNEGEMNMDLTLVSKWDMTDIQVISNRVFFKTSGTALSTSLEDFKKYFPTLLN